MAANWHEYGKLAFSANFLYLVLVTAAKKKPHCVAKPG